MLNPIKAYAEAGHKAGTARTQRDESRAKFETEHFNRMLCLESAEDRAAARSAFDAAYRKARGV